jgi:hypothetical protein
LLVVADNVHEIAAAEKKNPRSKKQPTAIAVEIADHIYVSDVADIEDRHVKELAALFNMLPPFDDCTPEDYEAERGEIIARATVAIADARRRFRTRVQNR